MAKHPRTREQKAALSAAKVAVAKKVADEGEEAMVPVWHHSEVGVRIQFENPGGRMNGEGTAVEPYVIVTMLHVIKRSAWDFKIVGGQTLPKGFLWGQADKQTYGFGGPHVVYGPIRRRCRDCKEMFVWPASAQKRLHETEGVNVNATAKRCHACARKRLAMEDARVVYAEAMAQIPAETSGPYVKAAKAALAVLEAGGKLSIDRAIGYCTRARKLGASGSVSAVEQRLRALRGGHGS